MIRHFFTGLIVTLTIVAAPLATHGQDIDFVEKFALSTDRESTLSELVPGTDQYYFYYCLHYQNTQRFDEAERTLKAWEKRRGNNGQIQQMRHRQALLTYTDNPDATVDYLIDKLNVKFNHQRKRPSAEPGLPTALDQSMISFERLNKRALARDNTNRYEDIALMVAATQELNGGQLRHLLQRLNHPSVPDLPALIDRDLKNRDAQPFGSYNIHRLLLLEQLEELARLRPKLRNQDNYVNIYLSKLLPNNDVVWQLDRDEHVAYLDRLWGFVSELEPSHNSLKANVLFRRLHLDRTMGVYDKQRFIEYLKLPRQVWYVRESLVKSVRSSRHIANLGANYASQTRLMPVNDDELLVRDFLHHFLVDAAGYDEFDKWVSDSYLKERFAEAKITAGMGDTEQWASMLSPAKYQELMKRVDLEFAFTNPNMFAVDDSVEIKLTTKNIKNLIVKVFEINTANFYRNNAGQIDTDINLDGLVPNWQRTFDYNDPAIQRVERNFTFDEIDHRGVFIVDFIGNGQSSRVMIRKGQLSHLVETTGAGHLFTVFNEKKEKIDDAALWIAGREYQPDKNGQFLVPFSNQPRQENVIIEYDGLSVRGQFNHLPERYGLTAGIYVDRESLLRMGQAEVIVRPQLRVSGQPAPLKLLEKVRLVVRATDLDGIESTKEFSDTELAEEFETKVRIMVPARLKTIHFELHGTIENVSQGNPQNVVASQTYNVNQIDTTDVLQTVHLRRNEDGYALAVRGKTGESRAAQAVMVKLKHRLFTDTVTANLQSDKEGQVQLGELKDIAFIQVAVNGRNERTWVLGHSDQTTNRSLHASTEQTIRIPFETSLPDTKFALIELRGKQYLKDHSSKVKAADGLVSIAPLEVGDYELLNQRTGRRHKIRVTRGKTAGAFLLGKYRSLEVRNSDPLYVQDVEVSEDKVRVQLGGDNAYARVHVIATRYSPRFYSFSELARASDIEPLSIREAIQLSGYMAGRSIGEEYQYILERQFKEKYPGNMLTRPSLLLNPWALRTTENDVQVAAGGEEFGAGGAGAPAATMRDQQQGQKAAANTDFANLDFLADGSVVLANLAANNDGVVEIDRALFGEKHMLQIVVQNHFHTLYREAVLPEFALEYRDLRLADGLDPERHFARQKRYTVLKSDEKFELTDISSAKFQHYDCLADIYRYYVTLTGNSQLVEFGFLMNWPNKSDDEKLELYKRYACHEFNFFLMQKDREYFDAVIVPYLENKMHKTFLDEYLLKLELGSWVEPWDFQRLNTVEQILLGRRMDDHRRRLDQFIGNDYDNHPTSRRDFDRLYDFAVVSNALDMDDKSVELNEQFNKKRELLRERGKGVDEAEADDAPAEDAESEDPSFGAQAMPRPANAAPSRRSRGRAGFRAEVKGFNKEAELRDSLELVDERYKDTGRDNAAGEARYYGQDEIQQQRKRTRQFYQRIKPTQEWVENNYYNLPIEQQNSGLVRVNRFWRDYALHNADEPFLSPFFAESSRNFTEMLLALSVIDLPFEAPEHAFAYEDNTMRLTPGNDLIAFFEQVRPSAFDRGETTVLISENFYRNDDRYRVVDGKTREKFVRKEFLSNVLYGGQIVITNPTSTPQEIDLLVQIPEGALPANGSHETRTLQMDMAAFSTQTLEYFFYFPTPGDFGHYPAHVSIASNTVAVADGLRFNVVESLSDIDTESWAWISQNGTEQQVLDFLGSQNLQAIDLGLIAFRLKDKDYYQQVIELLEQRFAFSPTLWSYSLRHKDADSIADYLQYRDEFVNMCGTFLDSPLLSIRPVIRHMYQHREYWPLVNARSHRLGSQRKILNNAIWQQYHQLLQIIARQNTPGDEEHLAMSHYLLLQDRISEAMTHFEQVTVEKLATRLQYDYCAAYLAMYQENPQQADQIARRYLDYPVKRWRDLFAAVAAQVKEIEGAATAVVDVRDPKQRQTEAASQTPTFEFVVESLKTKINYQNLEQVTINYYKMDVELLFSRNPFVKRKDDSFALIKPNASQTVSLPADQKMLEVDLPKEFQTSNVLVEVTGGGKTDRQAYYANSMNVQTIEQFGQVKVTRAKASDLLSSVYVKVYARKADGSVHFYKDGYTDLRGRFDYASLSNQNLNDVDKFAILVISPDYGAVVREADVPKE